MSTKNRQNGGSGYRPTQPQRTQSQAPVQPVRTADIEQNFPATRFNVGNTLIAIAAAGLDFLSQAFLWIKGFVFSKRKWNNSSINEGFWSGIMLGRYTVAWISGSLDWAAYMDMQAAAIALAVAAWFEQSLPKKARVLIGFLAAFGWLEFRTSATVKDLTGLGYNSISFLLIPLVLAISWQFFRSGPKTPSHVKDYSRPPQDPPQPKEETPQGLTVQSATRIILKAFNGKPSEWGQAKSLILKAIRVNFSEESKDLSDDQLIVWFAGMVEEKAITNGSVAGVTYKALRAVQGLLGITTPLIQTWKPAPTTQPERPAPKAAPVKPSEQVEATKPAEAVQQTAQVSDTAPTDAPEIKKVKDSSPPLPRDLFVAMKDLTEILEDNTYGPTRVKVFGKLKELFPEFAELDLDEEANVALWVTIVNKIVDELDADEKARLSDVVATVKANLAELA